jgi:outer membrane protein
MTVKKILPIFFALLIAANTAIAADSPLIGPTAPVVTAPKKEKAPDKDNKEEIIPLALPECVRMALANNLDISIERLNPVISKAGILTAQGTFDPTFKTTGSYSQDNYPTIIDSPTATISKAGSYEISLNQTFSPGTQASILTNSADDMTTDNNFQDQYNTFVGFALTQPLLRGFGTDINLAPIRIAQRGLKAADAGFVYRVEQIITNVNTAYYELLYNRGKVTAQQKALTLAEQLLKDNKAKVAIGTMSQLDISEANSEVATRRGELRQAERAVLDQENAIKLLITFEVSLWLNKRIDPTTQPPDDWEPPQVVSSIDTGLRNRSDLTQAKHQLEENNIQVTVNQNQTLPTLNVSGAYGYSGLSSDWVRSYSRVANADNDTWSIGATLTIPIGDRTDRGNLDAAKAKREQALLNVKKIEQSIIVEIDNAAGQVTTNIERVKDARVARQYAEETLNAEQEKLNAGRSTSFVVLRLQRDLTDARVTELRAVADLQEALSELTRVQGLSLKENNIYLESTQSPPGIH